MWREFQSGEKKITFAPSSHLGKRKATEEPADEFDPKRQTLEEGDYSDEEGSGSETEPLSDDDVVDDGSLQALLSRAIDVEELLRRLKPAPNSSPSDDSKSFPAPNKS